MARIARLPLIFVVLALAACGGSAGGKEHASSCRVPLLDASRPHTVGVVTNLGAFAFGLDVKDSPCVSASFASLIRKGFFDGTVFHRIVPGFVIQGGDPTGTGTGGPGYTVQDVPPQDARYTKGVVAMAKTPSEPRGTAGSQFFVVTGADAGLPPDYAVLGKVTQGLAVVLKIGTLGDPTTEQPTKKVTIEKITIRPT